MSPDSKLLDKLQRSAEEHAAMRKINDFEVDEKSAANDFKEGGWTMYRLMEPRLKAAEAIIKENMGSTLDEIIEWRKKIT